MKTLNLFTFCQPGIYYIKCLKTKKIYIDQSENFLYRIGRHFNDLKSKVPHCEPLQKVFLLYGSATFEAKLLPHSKPKIKNEKSRKQLEEEIISTIGPLKCYNINQTNSIPVYKSYKYKGKNFLWMGRNCNSWFSKDKISSFLSIK